MALFRLRAFDEEICSEFPLPGAAVVADTDEFVGTPPSLTITSATAELSLEWQRSGSYALGPEGLCIGIAGIGTFLCDPRGSRIHVSPASDASLEEISAHLVANAVPAALWLRGHRLLHAGVAVAPGHEKAIVIAGPSQSGKSTVLMNLLQAGNLIVSEDVTSVVSDHGKYFVSGIASQIQLRQPERSAEQRTAFAVPESNQQTKATAGAIVILNPEDASASPRLLGGAEALQNLLRNRYRNVVPRLIGREPADFAGWASLTALLPVYSWNLRFTKQKHWGSVLTALVQ